MNNTQSSAQSAEFKFCQCYNDGEKNQPGADFNEKEKGSY